jgi:CRISPR/Cas system CSM-associated protein Csm2 small subunit
MQSAAKTKIKEIREAEGIGAGDFKKGEIGRKEQALSEIDQVIQTMVDRINAAGDEEVVNEILRLLAFKLNSVGYNKLYSKIERKVKEKSIDEIKRMQKLAGIDETKIVLP